MKHAFLIIAHNEPYILDILINKLNKIPGGIIVHVDKKVKEADYKVLTNVIISGG